MGSSAVISFCILVVVSMETIAYRKRRTPPHGVAEPCYVTDHTAAR